MVGGKLNLLPIFRSDTKDLFCTSFYTTADMVKVVKNKLTKHDLIAIITSMNKGVLQKGIFLKCCLFCLNKSCVMDG